MHAGSEGDVRPFIVYPIVGVGLLFFASSAILVRLASDVPGLVIATWRTLFAVAFLAPFALMRALPEMRRLTARDGLWITAAGVFLGLHFVTWIESLYHTSVASASVLVCMSPIFLAALGFLLLRERVSFAVVAAIVLAVGGAALIALADAAAEGGGGNSSFGNALAFLAALLVSFYLLIGRVVRQRTSWLAYVFPLYTVVAITVLVLAVATGTRLTGYDTSTYGWCVLMALGPQIIGHGSFNFAVRYVPAAILGLLSLAEPVGASLAAFLLFDERPGPAAMLGMAIVMAAIAFAIVRQRSERAAATIRAAGDPLG